MMQNFLMVPLRVDGLFVVKEKKSTEAMVDFVRMPYFNGLRDVNFNTANISEEILSQPFQNQNFDLKAGVHLHWAMPDALSHGENVQDPATGEIKTVFAAVPNRWLIARIRRLEADSIRSVEAEWIVESDYLYPDGEGFQSGSISYPVMPNPSKKEFRPFRFMGRKVPLNRWETDNPSAEYLDHLTAVGYGQPAFAAFYPNCHSVFGFHDNGMFPRDKQGNPIITGHGGADSYLHSLSYEIFGWYSDESKDYYRQTSEAILARLNKQNLPADKLSDAFREALQEEFRWAATGQFEGQNIPSRLLCYSRIDFHPQEEFRNLQQPVWVAVGNSGSEALAALLAPQINAAKVPEIEDQLAALQFAERLDHLPLDMGFKFQEARHEQGFQAASGGLLWTIRPEVVKTAKADAEMAGKRSQITLPDAMAHQLNTVNLLQKSYDDALTTILSLRKQLFSDWYKYMLCAYPPEDTGDDYPDPDRVKFFIEEADLLPLQNLQERTGKLLLKREPAGSAVIAASAPGASPAAIAAQLAGAIQRLLDQIAAHNKQKTVKDAGARFKLKPTSGPRYWQPREPVVLISGEAARATERHGQSQSGDYLPTQVLAVADNFSVQEYILTNLQALRGTIETIANTTLVEQKTSPAFNRWERQPWHPFLLSWEVDVRPLQNKSNMDPANQAGDPGVPHGYAPDFITANYQLPETAVDLQLKETAGVTITREPGALKENIYSGTTVLTPQAGLVLRGKLKAWLKKQVQASGFLKETYPGQKIDDNFIEENFADILQIYEQAETAKNPDSAVSRYIRIYRRVQDPGFNVLSQSLGGFNEALLMHKQTLQLPVAEPLAFPDYAAFTAAVGDALGKNITSAPVPGSEFNPMRSGEMELLRLQLIDTFGQVKDILHVKDNIPVTALHVAGPLLIPAVGGQNPGIALPPRLTQPARVAFRWLSADLGEAEMNEHPASTPVCGWLLSNHLDNSLMIYDNRGKVLGSIDQLGRWQTAPGSNRPVYPLDIANRHLHKLVHYLLERGSDFQQEFISTIDSAMRTIEPANFAQHQARALLMGRPVALVRASVGLELQGMPAIHQGWSTFIGDMDSNRRHSDLFEAVKLPLRIGEFQQLNDGLVGYWIEEQDAYRDQTFYSPQSTIVMHEHIKTHGSGALNLYKSLQDAPDTLLMLVDPRGAVHATSGVLPTKSIDLPPDQVSDALQQIEITFLSTPILSDAAKLHLPLPREAGYRWSWLERKDDYWHETGTVGVVKRQTFLKAFPNGSGLYVSLLEKGWLKKIDDDSAIIIPADQRPAGDPGKNITAALPAIEDLFDRAHITAPSDRARFSGRQVLREGWLKLSKDEQNGETK